MGKKLSFERLDGDFTVQGPLYKAKVFSGKLADGTEFCVACKDLESIGSVLDQLQWVAEVDVNLIQAVVIHIGAEGSFKRVPKANRQNKKQDDDIPF